MCCLGVLINAQITCLPKFCRKGCCCSHYTASITPVSVIVPLSIKTRQVQVLTFSLAASGSKKTHENLLSFAKHSPSLLDDLIRVCDAMCCSGLRAKISILSFVVSLPLVCEPHQTEFEITSGGCLLFKVSD